MTFQYIQFAFTVLEFLLLGGIGFYVYMSNKDKVTNERVTTIEAEVKNKLNAHGEQIARLETHVTNAPTHDDLGDMYEKINQVSACVTRLEGEFSGAKHTLDLIHEFLMKGSGK